MNTHMTTLHIDTSGIREASVTLTSNGIVYEKTSSESALRSQALLPLIEDVAKEANITLTDITHITVVLGPGSYTGLRVGLSVANMLGELLNVPINGKKALATPVYS